MANATSHEWPINDTADTETSTARDERLASIEIGTLSVILFLAVTSNLSMLIAIWRQRRNRPLSRMYYFMMHLSFADLLVAIFNILPQLAWEITYRFRGGDFLCRFVKYTQVMTLYLSTYILMFMAVDRYRAVCCRNLHWNSLKMAKCFVAVSWLLALLFSIPQAVIFGEQEVAAGVTDCWVRFIEPWGAKAYVTWFVASIFVAPLMIIGVCYGIICRQIWLYSKSAQQSPPSLLPPHPATPPYHKPTPTTAGATAASVVRRWLLRASLRWQKSRWSNSTASTSATTNPSISSDTIPMRSLNHLNKKTTPVAATISPDRTRRTAVDLHPRTAPFCQLMPLRRSNSNRITKAKMKTIKLTLAVVVCFVACWAPFCITQLVMVYSPPSNQADVSPVAVIILLLASLNSCTNPWIYLAFSGSLFNQMRVCFGLRWLRRNDNDSIGDDDRRGVGAVAHRYNGSNPIVRHQQEQRLRGAQQDTVTPEQPFAALPTAAHCSRADVVTHFKCNGKAEEAKRMTCQGTDNCSDVHNREIENPLA